jgi:hypothetical protein
VPDGRVAEEEAKVRRLVSFGVMVVVALALSCASGGGSNGGSSGEASQTAEAKAPPKGVPAPAGHPLAKVEEGMGAGDVTRIMGEPTSTQTYQTGKAWIPYYFGSDTHRIDWKYKGEGRVVFGQNRWSGNLKVIRIDYDPDEDGY